MVSLEETRQVVDKYLHGHDTSVIADDATFELMASGEKVQGKAAIEGLLDGFYSKTFTAKYEVKRVTYGEGRAVLEADFYGKQNMEFAGIQPSPKEVHVPLCVSYDVSGGKITRARVYFLADAIRAQK